MGRKSGWFYRAKKENQKNRSDYQINIKTTTQMAHEEQAILVGTQTVIVDDNQKT
jgi:riboflavin biosynthesis pyrimidine reductase